MTTRKPRGYWKSYENTLAEATKAMTKHEWETLPCASQFQNHGYSSLSIAIVKYHGGFPTFRTKLGQTNPQKPTGYWQNLDNTIKEAQQAMKKHGWTKLLYPSLKKNGYSSLTIALNTFRTTLGQTNTKKPPEYWQKLENTIAEAQQTMQKHGWSTLPSQKELVKYGYASLSQAISRYHGGLPAFRTTLGQTNLRKPRGYWESLDNTIAEAQQAMQKHGWSTLPSHGELTKYRYHSLTIAISKYHGRIRNFRKLLTEHETCKTQKQQLEELLDEYIAA